MAAMTTTGVGCAAVASPTEAPTAPLAPLGPLASTRAACGPDSLAPRLASSWPYVRSYLIEGGRLHLGLMADGGVLTWTPAP